MLFDLTFDESILILVGSDFTTSLHDDGIIILSTRSVPKVRGQVLKP